MMESVQSISMFLTVVAGMFLAFLFEYVPGFATWYQPLTEQEKRLIMLGLLALAAMLSMGLACYAPYNLAVTCDVRSAWDLLAGFVMALGLGAGSNQALHRLIKR